MVDAERDAFRADVSGALTQLNEILTSEIGPDETDQVGEYIEHHEFGLALELMMALIIKHGVDGRAFRAGVNSLSRRMGMQDSPEVAEWRKYSSDA
jgi:hypothetical protein